MKIINNLILEVKSYNWQRLISDLFVALAATALSFLLERVKELPLADLGATATGALGVGLNWIKRIYC